MRRWAFRSREEFFGWQQRAMGPASGWTTKLIELRAISLWRRLRTRKQTTQTSIADGGQMGALELCRFPLYTTGLTPTLTPTQATIDNQRRTQASVQTRKISATGQQRTATDRRRGVPKP